ncbi:MAG TPA: PAC2 family protein [Candidatus Limnocylindrales bacterium]|nr:PAC2 family protein [Candidatus Limnocylindrales bacterium]
MPLYRLSVPDGLHDPVMVVALDGWVDAGSAATTAVEQLLARRSRIVARFDSDVLFDYRARRPTLEIVDGRADELSWPELTIRLSRHPEQDLLIMTGPEPDFLWHELCRAAVEIAARLEVRQWITLGAVPAPVPHTRAVPIMGTASRPDLLRGGVQPGPAGLLRVPAAAVSVLDVAVERANVPAVGYFAQVPNYLTGPYPAAAVALIRTLGRHLGLSLPIGELEQEAEALRERLDLVAAGDEATRSHIERLETLLDQDHRPSGDELISDIERFLREGGASGRGRP